MISLDMAIVNVALPSIQADLGVGPGVVQWVVVAYGLLLGGFLLFGGRMADRLGRKRIFITGLAVFTAASETMREVGGAAGVAAVSTVLVAGSGLAGFHSAFAFVGVLAILAVITAAVGFARRRV